MDEEALQLAERLWEYHHLDHRLKKADLLLVMCSHDIRVAQYARKLFLEGYAPLVLFSGGIAHKGDLLETGWDKPEAIVFSEIAKNMGVPEDKILIEDKATNCGENIVFSIRLLEERGIRYHSIIIAQKPYMERRAYATAKAYLKDTEIIITSPKVSFADYPNELIRMDDLINIMVGDLERIRIYSKKGYQIHQAIPRDVWDAGKRLIKKGFDRHLVRH